MKRNGYSLVILLTMAISVMYIFDPNKNHTNPREKELARKERKEFSDAARIHQEFLMLRDPRTNRIPGNIRNLELRFAEQLPKHYGTILLKGSQVQNAQALTWTERGPNNIGGRVRSLGIDARNTSIIITGGVSGGIWKSLDAGTSWTKKTGQTQLHSVTHIIQDTRTGKNDTWYAGTGENDNGNSASGGYIANYNGDGVFKSTDNGDTWNPIASTQVNSPGSWTSDWQYIWRLAIDRNDAANDVVFAATNGGVYKTSNGGTAWSKILDSGAAPGTNVPLDIATADNGTLYVATGSSGAADAKGIRKSINGGTSFTDITPATMPATYGRIVFAIAPGDNNILYFLVQGVSGANSTPSRGVGGAEPDKCQLWRSSDAGVSWTNISTVIPVTSHLGLEDFKTQSGYDMLLSVRPGTGNENFVIFGGVSLFKVHNVLATGTDTMTVAQKHIGGYGISANGTANALSDFKNHHPDQHYGYFQPGSNTVFYCGNDGGIHVANDITATSSGTFWDTPKRSSLNVSQFYGVSIAPESGSGYIAGGFQDRGNWMSKVNNTGNTPADWSEQSGGDGTICAIAPNALNTVYQSTSNGNIFRYAKDDAASPVTSTDMKPTGAQNLQFVNPFILDPNDGNLLYFSGGSTAGNGGVWRNTSASTATTETGWSFITTSAVTGTFVSALAASTTNSANVLYFGTADGKVYRLDGANTGNPTLNTITGGTFPAGSYVSSITVDPTNSANVMVTFSNYNVARVWYSTDSGTSWTDVTGNLTGANGPSVRWAKIFYVNSTPHYFLATSTGVYYTLSLSGSVTWTQEATSSIGNVVVSMLDFRSSDNTLVAATHGRGAFQTTIASALPVELTSFAGAYNGTDVTLTWQTATEVNNYGFNVERSSTSPGMTWEKIGFVQGHGNSNSTKSYSFTDKNAPTGKVYYRLKQIDFDGKYEYSNIVEVNVNALNRLELAQNFPNPFNPVTTISYSLPNVSKVKLVIYDVTGREVATLVNDFQSAGKHSVNFNASRIASGVYYYRIQAGDIIQTKKMILVK